jgi:hypothetical protein
MAMYFLEKCRSYREEVNQNLIRRRAVICNHMNEKYKINWGQDEVVFKKVVAELKKEGLTITRDHYREDKLAIRNSYLYLTSPNEDARTSFLAQLQASQKSAINYLIRDGIKTWSELVGVSVSEEKETTLVELVHPSTPFSLSDHQIGAKVIESQNVLLGHLEAMVNENEIFRKQIIGLTNEVEEMKKQNSETSDIIPLYEAELKSLEDQLHEATELVKKSHSTNLAEMALLYPEIPELLIASTKIEQKPSRRDEEVKKLLSLLPSRYSWQKESGTIEYQKYFLNELARLSRDEQALVIEQVGILSTHGSDYMSLYTRKLTIRIPHSPDGCMQSRGSQSIRFTWKKNGGITMYWLYRKGESSVRMSEK